MEILFLMLVSFLCGVTCATIASDKGRNKGEWFAIGLFTAVFGIVMIACLSRREPKPKANSGSTAGAASALAILVLTVSFAESAIAANDRPSASQLISRLTHASCLYPNLRYEPNVRVCGRDLMRARSSTSDVRTEVAGGGGLPGDKWSWIEVRQDWDTGRERVRVALHKHTFNIPEGESGRYAFEIQGYWSGSGFDNPACQFKCISYSNGPGSTASSKWNTWVTAATLRSAMHGDPGRTGPRPLDFAMHRHRLSAE